MEWQPIETAPKDGTEVLLSEYGEIYIGWCGKNGWHFIGIDIEPKYNAPSNWMPLPPPPSE